MSPLALTTLLLVVSNAFMTVAWYWHLKYPGVRLWVVILISWALAGVEYCVAVPANRIGSQGGLSGGQLKILQEAITLTVFVIFSLVYLHERFRWQYAVGVALVFAGVFVIFSTDTKPAHAEGAAGAAAVAAEKSAGGAAMVTTVPTEERP